jgi:hypothetical protein
MIAGSGNPQALPRWAGEQRCPAGFRQGHSGVYERVRAGVRRRQLATCGCVCFELWRFWRWIGDVVDHGHTARSERCACLPRPALRWLKGHPWGATGAQGNDLAKKSQVRESPTRRDLLDHVFAFGRPRQDSNLRTRLRRPLLYPLSYGGSGREKDYQYRTPRRTAVGTAWLRLGHVVAGTSQDTLASRRGAGSGTRARGRRR